MNNMRKKLVVLGLVASIAVSQGTNAGIVTEAKSSDTKIKKTFDKEVTDDVYQKAIAKGFLGKKYGTGKGRYLCNTYVKKALEKVANKKLNKTKGESFKNLKISPKGEKSSSAPTSYDWNSYRVKITFRDCVYDEETDEASWESQKSYGNIKKQNCGTSYDSLELGQVLAYNGHVALYFGKYESMDEVAERLVELGVYKEGSLTKKSDRYVNKKGRTIIREYSGAGEHWRIHATCSGLMIDNSIVSKSSLGTSSFGKWKKSIPTGIEVVEKEEELDPVDTAEAAVEN